MLCLRWQCVKMCNMAGQEHIAQLSQLALDEDLVGFEALLDEFQWDKSSLLLELNSNIKAGTWPFVKALICKGVKGDLESLNLLNKHVEKYNGEHVLGILKGFVNNGFNVLDCTFLMFNCSIYGYGEVVQYLLDSGCDPNGQYTDNVFRNLTCLIGATMAKHNNICHMLLAHPDIDINMYNTSRMTALHMCVKFCQHELMKVYIKRSPAMLEFKNIHGGTPLQTAIFQNCNDCAKVLIEYGANLNAQNTDYEFGLFNTTPLMLSISQGNETMVDILMKHKRCDINVADSSTGLTALHLAADIGQLRTVLELLKRGAHANPLDHDCASPLLLAINERHSDVAFALLPYVGNPDPTGQILFMAFQRELYGLLEPLMILGARIVYFFHNHSTPIQGMKSFDWKPYTSQPKSLKHQSMLKIRKILVTVNSRKVSCLGLPRNMTEFILVSPWLLP